MKKMIIIFFSLFISKTNIMETKIQSITRKQKIEEEKFDQFLIIKDIKRFSYTALDCSYDTKFHSGNTYCIGEIKVRKDKDMTYFEKFGPYLELKKIEGMYKEQQSIKEKTEITTQMIYFNFSSNGLQVFYLTEPWTYSFSWKFLPKDNFDPSIKIWKMVAELKNPQEQIYI